MTNMGSWCANSPGCRDDMSIESQNSAFSFRTPLRSERGLRRYLFAITAAAVFLVVLVVLARPRNRQPVAAIFTVAPSAISGLDHSHLAAIENPETLRAALTSEERLHQAVRGLPTEFGPQRGADVAEQLSTELHVEVAGGPEGRLEVTVAHSGDQPFGAALVNNLVERFVNDQRSKWVSAAQLQADQRLRETHSKRVQSELAKDRLRHLEEQHPNIATWNPDAVREPAPSHAAPAKKPAAPTTQLLANPEWANLAERFRELKTQREEMLVRLNRVHPAVQQLDLQISRVGEQLQVTPQFIAQRREPPTEETSEPAADEQAVAQAEQAKLAREYRQLQAASQRVSQELVRLEAASQRTRATVDAARTSAIRIEKPAVQSVNNPWQNLPALVIAVILASVCGGLMVQSGVPEDPTFRNADEVEESLSIPVVGVLSATEASPEPYQPTLSTRTMLVRRACEATIVVVLIYIALARSGA